MAKSILALGLVWLFCLPLRAQTITNIRAIQADNEVVLTYRLDGDPGKAYHVQLYASYNNFNAPLREVTGDVSAKRLLPGAEKSIRWNALVELKNFNDEVEFELRAKPAPALFTDIAATAAAVKRGKSMTIQWKSTSKEPVLVELKKGAEKVGVGTAQNSQITFAVPANMKTGHYHIALQSAGEVTESTTTVTIKPKFPLLLKLAPLAIAGIVVGFMGGGGETPPPADETLPSPPDLTGN